MHCNNLLVQLNVSGRFCAWLYCLDVSHRPLSSTMVSLTQTCELPTNCEQLLPQKCELSAYPWTCDATYLGLSYSMTRPSLSVLLSHGRTTCWPRLLACPGGAQFTCCGIPRCCNHVIVALSLMLQQRFETSWHLLGHFNAAADTILHGNWCPGALHQSFLGFPHPCSSKSPRWQHNSSSYHVTDSPAILAFHYG